MVDICIRLKLLDHKVLETFVYAASRLQSAIQVLPMYLFVARFQTLAKNQSIPVGYK